jgi:hypothetical protein
VQSVCNFLYKVEALGIDAEACKQACHYLEVRQSAHNKANKMEVPPTPFFNFSYKM